MTAPVRLPSAALPTAVWSDWSCLVRLVVTDRRALDPAAADLAALMRRVERAASRFLPDSELCWANVNAGRPVAVSRTLARLVETAVRQAALSAGAVDPTLGRELARLGYDRDITLVTGSTGSTGSGSVAGLAERAVPRPSWRAVRLDERAGLLTVPVGCALDLGASAKSQTADWAAAELAGRYGCGVLVEIGGDLAIAGDKTDWQVTVAERAGTVGQQVTLAAGGLATSTTTIRRWQHGGRTVHHILDPASGLPAAGPWRTVSVAAHSATHANTCSTAAIVLGDRAPAWLAAQPVAARLIDQAGTVLRLGGWPQAVDSALVGERP